VSRDGNLGVRTTSISEEEIELPVVGDHDQLAPWRSMGNKMSPPLARMGVEPPYLLVAWAEQRHYEGYNSTRCKYISGQLQRIAETK
jgi:hypothetical protein